MLVLTPSSHYLASSFEASSLILTDPNRDHSYRFPDDEVYISSSQLTKLNDPLSIIHTGAPDPNGGLLELEFTLDLCFQHNIPINNLSFTYFPYCQQDHTTNGDLNIPATLMQKWTQYYHVQHITILDPHFGGQDWLATFPVTTITAVDLLQSAVTKQNPDVIFISPDAGMQRRSGIAGITKVRKDSFTNEFPDTAALKQLIKNKPICIIDDIIETGGTLATFIDHCRQHGATSIYAAATHPLLATGVDRIASLVTKLITTNSIRQEFNSENIEVLEVGELVVMQ